VRIGSTLFLTVGARRQSPTQKRAKRSKLKRARIVIINQVNAPPPSPPEKKEWSRDQKIGLAGAVISILAIVIALATPEIRKTFGLDHGSSREQADPATISPLPKLEPETNPDVEPTGASGNPPQAPKKTKRERTQHKKSSERS
jgi:hypothetical protein